MEYDSIKKQYLDRRKPIIYFNSNIGYNNTTNLKSKKKIELHEQLYHYSLVKPIQEIFKKYFNLRYHWDGDYHDIPYIVL